MGRRDDNRRAGLFLVYDHGELRAAKARISEDSREEEIKSG
jgi:hypothetical protein